ncbi:MAG: cell division protein FtsL [Deltaproteobacteria bacterium]
MKALINILLTAFTLAMGFWAYQQNYATKDALKDVSRLQSQMRALKEEQAVLNAEWAYLNRPERLRELVNINFAKLRLLPLLPAQFGRVEQIAYPLEVPTGPALNGVTDLSAPTGGGQ